MAISSRMESGLARDALTAEEQGAAQANERAGTDVDGREFAAYQFACDDLQSRLTDADWAELRRAGSLPSWFLEEMERQAVAIRRESTSG